MDAVCAAHRGHTALQDCLHVCTLSLEYQRQVLGPNAGSTGTYSVAEVLQIALEVDQASAAVLLRGTCALLDAVSAGVCSRVPLWHASHTLLLVRAASVAASAALLRRCTAACITCCCASLVCLLPVFACRRCGPFLTHVVHELLLCWAAVLLCVARAQQVPTQSFYLLMRLVAMHCADCYPDKRCC
jgi:hypothetical protein